MKPFRCAILVVAVSLSASLSAKIYELVDLGRPPEDVVNSRYLGDPKLNNAGTIALTATDAEPGGVTQVYAFRGGAYAEIPNPTGWNITLESINDYDDIVGGLYLPTIDEEALVFRDGFLYNAATAQFQLISALTGFENMSPRCINNSGVLLLASDFDDLAVVYDGGMTFLLEDVNPSFRYGVAWELNNAGQILFNPDLVFPSSGVPDYWESNQFLYTIGDAAAEPLPEGTPWTPEWVHFNRVNDYGMVAGGSEVGLVLYQGGEGMTIASLNVSVAEINNDGVVVGMYGPWDARHPFLYDGKSLKDVNSLTVKRGRGDWTIISASGVNDFGQVTGLMRNSSGEVHVFLLSPKQLAKPLSQLESLLQNILHVLSQPVGVGFGLF